MSRGIAATTLRVAETTTSGIGIGIRGPGSGRGGTRGRRLGFFFGGARRGRVRFGIGSLGAGATFSAATDASMNGTVPSTTTWSSSSSSGI